MKKIVFFSIPLFGHVNYGLKIAKQLTKNGYDVEYYSGTAYKNFIENSGVKFKPYSTEIENLFSVENSSYNNAYMQHVRAEQQDHVTEWYKFSHHLYTIVNIFMKCDINNMDKPDLIIYDSAALWGRFVAKYFNIKCVASCTPYTYPKDYVLADYSRFARLILQENLNDLEAKRTIHILNATLNRSLPEVNDCSILEPLYPIADYRLIYTIEEFQAGIEYINDGQNFFCGIMAFSDEFKDNCDDLIDKNKKNIYIAFGSIYNNAEIFQELIDSCKGLDYNFILNIGSTINPKLFENLPKNWKIVKRVNQLSLLQNIDIFVSHGGVNSVREAVHCGVPIVVMPSEGDTLCTAEDIKNNKIGIELKIDNLKDIGKIITELLHNKIYKSNCKKLSKKMQNKCGIMGVVKIIDKILEDR